MRIAHILKDCSSCELKTLGLYRNSVGDDGAVALASMLSRNTIAVSALFLGGNNVRNRGVEALAQSLRNNSHLKVSLLLLF